jgi:nucleoside-diphosphate-sugar epimerase
MWHDSEIEAKMKMLVTGGYVNIGIAVLEECLKRGHEVAVFDVQNPRTARQAKRYPRRAVETLWGDIRKRARTMKARRGAARVTHFD